MDRRERCGAGADHDADRSPGDAQEASVALRRALVGRERQVGILAQDVIERGRDPVDVAAIGHAHQGAPPACAGCSDGLSDQERPVGARSRRPDGPRAAALGQVCQERVAALVVDPGRLARGRVEASPGGLHGRFRLRRGMARRDREPEDIGPAAGVPLGEGAAQRDDLGSEHRLGAHRPADRSQSAGMVTGAGALDDVGVDVLAREPHLHPRAGHDLLGERGRDAVVEGPVEVGQREVDEDPRDRVDLRGRGLGRTALPGRRGLDLGVLDGRAQARQLLLRTLTHRRSSTSSRRRRVESRLRSVESRAGSVCCGDSARLNGP